jgi:serine/threonine-protein kinase
LSPPKYVLGTALDSSCDLYSLGLILWLCATGRLPISGTKVLKTLQKQIDILPPPLQRECPELPKPFCKLVKDMVKKKPAARPGLAAARKGLDQVD